MTQISERVERLRNDVGLSQDACAARTGLSQSTLSRIESGREPNLGEVAALSRVFGCFISTITDSSPMLDRLETAARTKPGAEVDSTEVAERLGFYLELDAKLRRAGFGVE